MKRIRGLIILLVVGLCFYSVPAQANSVPTVGLELLLLADVSGSMDSTEIALQQQGYGKAFQDPTIGANIALIPGGIAVGYAQWSGASQQSLVIGWAHLTDATSAYNFGQSILDNTIRIENLYTAPGSAINWAVGQFANNYEGNSLVINISGDGSQNNGANTFDAATAAYASGITINGLPILGSEANLDTWYLNNIVNPGGGFMIVAADIYDFQDAIREKISREVNIVPEPATMLLLGSGLIGLAGYARRRFKK